MADQPPGVKEAQDRALVRYLGQRGITLTVEQLGEPFGGYDNFDACVAANTGKGDPHAYCGAIKMRTEEAKEAIRNGRAVAPVVAASGGTIKVFESLADLEKHAFSWRPDLQRLKEAAKTLKGKFILVEGLHPMVTDPFNVGHGAREWTESNLLRSTYTAIGKGLNINHDLPLVEQYQHLVFDGEFNEKTTASEYILYEEDPEIHRLINQGYITAVSMQGYPRHVEVNCGGGMCKKVPHGVMFGEKDGVAMAYIVTKEGATYHGRPVPKTLPGDFNSSLRMLEMLQPAGNNSLNGAGATGHRMPTAVTREMLAEGVKDAKLKEAILTADKWIGEDLKAFNEALANGDALGALKIVAGDLYGKMQAEQAAAQQQQQGAAQGGANPPGKQEESQQDKATQLVNAVKEAVLKSPEFAAIKATMEAVKTLPDSMRSLQEQVKETNGAIDKLKMAANPAAPAMMVNDQLREDLGFNQFPADDQPGTTGEKPIAGSGYTLAQARAIMESTPPAD